MAKKSAKCMSPGIDQQLREAIRASEHSQAVIARETGVSQGILSRFVTEDEDARRDLRLETAAKLARFLGLHLAPIRGH